MVTRGSVKPLSTSPWSLAALANGWTRPGRAYVLAVSILVEIRLGWANETVAAAPRRVNTKIVRRFIVRTLLRRGDGLERTANTRLDGGIAAPGYKNSLPALPAT